MPLTEQDHVEKQTKTQSAWERHPHAATIEAAEAADSISNKFASNQLKVIHLAKIFETAISPVKAAHESTLKAWQNTPNEERYILPSTTRIELSKRLMKDEEGNNARAEVFTDSYSNYEINPAYMRWQQIRSAELLERLEKSPLVKDAEKNWNNPAFGIHEKIEFAQEIHNLHADAFGFTPATVTPYIEEPSIMVDKEGNPTNTSTMTNGYHFGEEQKLALNIYRGADRPSIIHRDFPSFVELVIHEGEHALQDQLAKRVEIVRDAERSALQDLGVNATNELSPEGMEIYKSELDRRIKIEPPYYPGLCNQELSGDGALAAHAEYMRHNYNDSYMSSASIGISHEQYLSNPIEKEARDLGTMISIYFDQSPDERSNYIASYRHGAYQSETLENQRLNERTIVTRKQEVPIP